MWDGFRQEPFARASTPDPVLRTPSAFPLHPSRALFWDDEADADADTRGAAPFSPPDRSQRSASPVPRAVAEAGGRLGATADPGAPVKRPRAGRGFERTSLRRPFAFGRESSAPSRVTLWEEAAESVELAAQLAHLAVAAEDAPNTASGGAQLFLGRKRFLGERDAHWGESLSPNSSSVASGASRWGPPLGRGAEGKFRCMDEVGGKGASSQTAVWRVEGMRGSERRRVAVVLRRDGAMGGPSRSGSSERECVHTRGEET